MASQDFTHEFTQEAFTNTIHIEEFNPPTVKRMLAFLYKESYAVDGECDGECTCEEELTDEGGKCSY